MPQPVIIDIETIVDKALIHETHYPQLANAEEAYHQFLADLSKQTTGKPFVPVTYHLPCSIAVGSVSDAGVLISVESLGSEPDLITDISEELTTEFWYLVNTGVQLVTFNGRGFDLPVMELAALRYGVPAPTYWTSKYGPRNRYSGEAFHMDLQEVLTNFGASRLHGGLNALMHMLGYRGKEGMSGSDVQEYYEAGRLAEIDAYCRRDVISTYALWLHVMFMTGRLSVQQEEHAHAASDIWLQQIR